MARKYDLDNGMGNMKKSLDDMLFGANSVQVNNNTTTEGALQDTTAQGTSPVNTMQTDNSEETIFDLDVDFNVDLDIDLDVDLNIDLNDDIDFGFSDIKTLSIAKLIEFSNHPYQVNIDEEMQELMDSIEKQGVVTPIIVRLLAGTSNFEIVSGHRRTQACKLLNIEEIPAIIKQLDDDEATILMVDSNIQREHIQHSERAFAYKMRLDAIKRQAGRISHTNNTTTAKMAKSIDIIGEVAGISGRQVQRYVKLTELIPDFMVLLDDGQLKFTIALELAFLPPAVQSLIKSRFDLFKLKPSLKQVKLLRDRYTDRGVLRQADVDHVILDTKPKIHVSLNLTTKDLQSYFPEDTTPDEMLNVIHELLEEWFDRRDSDQTVTKAEGTVIM